MTPDTPAQTVDPTAAAVLRVVPENHDTASLFLDAPGLVARGWKPGQYASIRVRGLEGWSEPHPFTISSAPEDGVVRFTIKAVGRFSSAVRDLEPGREVKVTGPFGAFCGDIGGRPETLLVTGGVGITPFLSVLRHFRAVGSAGRIVMVWGNKTWADAFGADELADLTDRLDFRLVHVLERAEGMPQADPARPGVVLETGFVTRDVLARHAGPQARPAVYLCGPPRMHDFVLSEAAALGWDPGAVQVEKFSLAGPAAPAPKP
jgi:NAD(P)H-flavin reductase